MASVLVLPHRAVRGWGGGDVSELFEVVELVEALRREYRSDAHFCPYALERAGELVPRIPRLNKSARELIERDGGRIVFGSVVLDVDDPDAHRNGGPASDEWRMEQDDLLGELDADLLSSMGRYDTRGGYRLVWMLSERVGIDRYLSIVGKLRQELYRGGVVADKLEDWGRLYRLPFVLRDGVPQRWESDFSQLGELQVARFGAAPAATGGVFAGIEQAGRGLASAPGKITESRNVTLMRLAGGFRRRGLPFESILGMLQVINLNQCEPPLDDEEVESIARSVCRYDAGDGGAGDGGAGDGEAPVQGAGPRFTLGDEVELARAVRDDVETGEPLVSDRSALWRYSTTAGVWEELLPDVIHRVVQGYSGEGVMRGLDRQGNPRIAPLKVSHRLCEGVRSVLGSATARHGFFDDAVPGLVFRDVFVRVDRQGVRTDVHAPRWRQRDRLPFNYEPDASPSRFLELLRSCWQGDDDVEQKIQLLREWVGCALLGTAPQYAKALVLVGTGANGKSTVQTVVSALFPAGSVTSIPPQDMDQEYRRAALSRARLNLVAELPEADILVSEAVKALIAGDLMTARYIREAVFEFRPRAAHLFSANTLPGVRDMTTGFWRRWLVLGFNREIPEHEQRRGLAEEIIREELPEIAAWVVGGAAELAKRGAFDTPKSSKDALGEWRRSADQVAGFVEERCVVGDGTTSASELYNAYCQWCQLAGHRRLSQVNFGKRLRHLGIDKVRRSSGIEYDLELISSLSLVV